MPNNPNIDKITTADDLTNTLSSLNDIKKQTVLDAIAQPAPAATNSHLATIIADAITPIDNVISNTGQLSTMLASLTAQTQGLIINSLFAPAAPAITPALRANAIINVSANSMSRGA